MKKVISILVFMFLLTSCGNRSWSCKKRYCKIEKKLPKQPIEDMCEVSVVQP